jgi:hypothetical protein
MEKETPPDSRRQIRHYGSHINSRLSMVFCSVLAHIASFQYVTLVEGCTRSAECRLRRLAAVTTRALSLLASISFPAALSSPAVNRP